MSKRYGLKGINDDENECSVCGKVELKRVMWIVELDSDSCEVGEPFACGTTCGAKLMAQKITTVNKAVKSFRSYEYEQREIIKQSTPEYQQYAAIQKELRAEMDAGKLTFSERRADPRTKKLMPLMDAARTYAAAQPIPAMLIA